MEDFQNRHILVFGLGSSGLAVSRFLTGKGAVVTVTDMADEEKLAPFSAKIREMGVRMELGEHKIETVEGSDMIILSPGVSHKIKPVRYAFEKGIPVLGEMELAARFIQEPIIAITGTNGKTTTTQLTARMLEHSGFNVFTGGNIGTPLIEYAGLKKKADRVVAEVSSFQLDTIKKFRPHISVLLNVTEDHLDRYESFAEYAKSKARIFLNQTEKDYAVLNGSDPFIRGMAGKIKAGNLFFNQMEKNEKGAVIHCERIVLPERHGEKKEAIDLSRTDLKGKHNHENIAAASLAALAAGGSIKGIQSALDDFKGLSHRLEYVTTIDNVRYFDDSKATNVDAVLRALEAFSGGVILIMGGRDKGGGYDILKEQISKKVRLLIVIGEARKIISDAIGRLTKTVEAESIEEAVLFAHKRAVPEDSVLLSPACSSFDMFESYAQRGDAFCRTVYQIQESCS
ncbi:MAG: UDP-N-acetylmuramoyl-L-alanine--D-glutamate ligase [Desulfobacterales bacterium]